MTIMPIRFRCQFCNQLMGIARRKAGQFVHCPNCRNEVQVPLEEIAPAPRPVPQPFPAPLPPPAPAPAADPFDRDDFEAMLNGPGTIAPAPRPVLREEDYDVEPVIQPPPPGVVLTSGKVTVVAVVLILLLAIAFGAGLLVGRLYLR